MRTGFAGIRQEKLKEYIEEKNVVTIHELEKLFPEVSVMTIHRDLDVLEAGGFISKFRGGAKSVQHQNDPLFDARVRENQSGKAKIAGKALTMISPNSSIFLDASTTNLALAQAFPDISCSVLTTSPGIALELSKLTNPTITICCGTLHRRNLAVSGQNTLEMLAGFNIDVAFIGVSGCSVDAGFTCGTEDDMRVKRLVIEKARKSVVLCDKSKFNRLMPYTFCAIDEPDCLICDVQPPEKVKAAAQSGKVEIL